ncbi:hypothetical protein C0431_02035 [bacterium]|jgi:uncharacterized protein involved in exopolysaccharide biosynthesis|nr:hypothetical protein [bacterium]
MADEPGRDEIDVAELLSSRFWNWKSALGGAVLFGVVGLGVHFIAPPKYRAEMTLVFPASAKAELSVLTGAIDGSDVSGISYVAGLLSTRSALEAIGEVAKMKPLDVRKAMTVEADPISRQLRVGFVGDSVDQALASLRRAESFVDTANSQVSTGASANRMVGLIKRMEEKGKEVDDLESQLLDALETSDTVPTKEDEYTGGTYLAQLQRVQFELSSVKEEIAEVQKSASRIGSASSVGLPTGLEEEKVWREKLAEAQVEFDAAKAKYQPGTSQYREAKEKLDDAQKNLRTRITNYVKSVQSGANAETADLLGRKVVLEFQADDLRKKAIAAPEEASRFRELLNKIELERKAYMLIREQFDSEQLKVSTAVPDWVAIDDPYILDKPVNKSLLTNVAIPGFAGGLFGLLVGTRRKRS